MAKPKAVVVAATIASGCVAERLRLLHRTVNTIYDDGLRPLGLTGQQLTVLVVITNYGPVAPGAVARRLNMQKSTISRNVARMADKGWVELLQADAGNEQRLTLTTRGKALMVRALPLWEQAQLEAEALLGRPGIDSIRDLAKDVRGHLSPT